jgi:hypothetical protein
MTCPRTMSSSSIPSDRAIKYKLGRPEPDRRRYIWIGHKLQGDRTSSARSLLHPCDGLTDSLPTCPKILHVELWLPHPSAKRRKLLFGVINRRLPVPLWGIIGSVPVGPFTI